MLVKNTALTGAIGFKHKGVDYTLAVGDSETFPDTDYPELLAIVKSTTGLTLHLEDASTIQDLLGENGEVDVEAILLAINSKLTKPLKVHYLVEGGSFANLQAAIDAAVAGDVILVGPKASGNWGAGVIPSEKKISIVGMQGPRDIKVIVGSISFIPTSGDANSNTIYLDNLMISVIGTAPAIEVKGTAPVRFQATGCRLFRNTGLTTNLVEIENTHAETYVFIEDCFIAPNTGSAGGTLVKTECRWTRVKNCDLDGASLAVHQLGTGLLDLDESKIESNYASHTIEVEAGTAIIASTLVRNSNTNGTGALIKAGAQLISTRNVYDVGAGTGKCIDSEVGGILTQNQDMSAHITGVFPRNVKVSANATLLPLTENFTTV